MSTHDVSPFLRLPLRSLQEYERERGVIRGLSSFERSDIMNAAQEFAAALSCADGAPQDTRLHLRTFFSYLRDRLKTQALPAALEAVNYSDLPFERELAEQEAREEIRHQAYVRVMTPRGSGF